MNEIDLLKKEKLNINIFNSEMKEIRQILDNKTNSIDVINALDTKLDKDEIKNDLQYKIDKRFYKLPKSLLNVFLSEDMKNNLELNKYKSR